MAEKISNVESTRYAVVSGGNKGLGYETCKQLASKGVIVVLTSRDEKRGIEAIERLKKESNFTNDQVLFHQLDIMDPASISSLVDFINTKFGRLDILINNAGVGGLMVEGDVLVLKEIIEGDFLTISTENGEDGDTMKSYPEIVTNYELTKQCVETNYYGAKRMIEAFAPLLQLSNSPRIVNVASFLGKLKLLRNEWAKKVLSDEKSLTEEKVEQVLNEFLKDFTDNSIEAKGWPTYFSAYKVSKAVIVSDINCYSLQLLRNEWAKKVLSDEKSLTEEKVEQVLNEFLKDFTDNSIEAKGWPTYFSAYKVSKAALIAYTRILATKYPNFRVNSVCPGYCKTDVNANTGILTAEEGAESFVKLALLPNDGPSGLFFYRREVTFF